MTTAEGETVGAVGRWRLETAAAVFGAACIAETSCRPLLSALLDQAEAALSASDAGAGDLGAALLAAGAGAGANLRQCTAAELAEAGPGAGQDGGENDARYWRCRAGR